MTRLNRFQRPARSQQSVRCRKIQDAQESREPHGQLTNAQVREMVSAGAHAILRLGYHRGVGHIAVSEAVMVSTYLTAVATSEEMLDLYDDVLEGDESLKEMLAELSKRVAKEVADADRSRLEMELEAEIRASSATPRRSN
ncbi:hypothetical protein [Bosea sp. R86505]|uniref:hypothetical protein n=1 Tax=Bosea sp. R86505 TaxID=3101710 RepID=UPI0036714358